MDDNKKLQDFSPIFDDRAIVLDGLEKGEFAGSDIPPMPEFDGSYVGTINEYGEIERETSGKKR